MRYEHLRVLMEDTDLWGVFTILIQEFARANLPQEVLQAHRIGRISALQKDTGRIRGIVAGSVLRRLVCKAVAKQFASKLLEATAPFQYALQTRAGTEALAHTLRHLSEQQPDGVIVSLDGVGAFDHVHRASFLNKLAATPSLQPLVPLVYALYGTTSHFLWWDDQGEAHDITQGEG